MPKSKQPTKTKSVKSKDTKSKNTQSKTTKSKTVKKTRKSKPSKANQQLTEPESTVILVYANWCPHCQSMKPQWDEMKTLLDDMVEIIEIEDADLDKDSKIQSINDNKLNGETLDVAGYPTMLKIKNGRAEYYNGNRSATDMHNWVKYNNYGGYNKSKIRQAFKSIHSK